MKVFEILLGVILVLIVAAALLTLSAWIFMLLANVVLGWFGVKEINFWVSVCIVLLLSYISGRTTKKS